MNALQMPLCLAAFVLPCADYETHGAQLQSQLQEKEELLNDLETEYEKYGDVTCPFYLQLTAQQLPRSFTCQHALSSIIIPPLPPHSPSASVFTIILTHTHSLSGRQVAAGHPRSEDTAGPPARAQLGCGRSARIGADQRPAGADTQDSPGQRVCGAAGGGPQAQQRAGRAGAGTDRQ